MEDNKSEGFIQYINVSIDYGQTNVITNFNCTIQRNEKIVFAGPSGSGKSSLLNALMGFVPISEGEILVDGVSVNSTNIHQIRKTLSWLPQDIHFDVQSCRELMMLSFGFKENTALQPTEEEIDEMLDTLMLPRNILDKQVSEISGGQRQRLLLASVLLLKKPILLLDEPTSALDQESSKRIVYYLDQKHITLLSSSHDDYWNKNMDRILKINS